MTEQYRQPQVKRLYKSRRDRMIDGVCGGIAEYFDADPTIIRVLFVLSIFFGGTGLFLYIAGMIIMPVNTGHLASPEFGEVQQNGRSGKRLWGVILVTIGLFILIHNFGFFAFYKLWDISWGILLPIMIIILGMALIYSHQQARAQQHTGETNDTMNQTQNAVPYKRLFKSRRDRKLFGVCGGLGDYFTLDPTLIRILFILLAILSVGTGILLYLAMAIFVPDEPLSAER
jgi:phage shock protein C